MTRDKGTMRKRLVQGMVAPVKRRYTTAELTAQCDLQALMTEEMREWDRMPDVGLERIDSDNRLLKRIEKNRGESVRVRERRILLSHPLLFRALADPDAFRFTVGFWGLQVDDGWLEIVSEAAGVIEKAIEADIAAFDVRAHLKRLDRQQMHYVPAAGDPDRSGRDAAPAFACCVQVKEKLGGLSFYVRPGQFSSEACMTAIRAAIEAACARAEVTCEKCGAPGRQRGNQWLYVSCDACEESHTAGKGH